MARDRRRPRVASTVSRRPGTAPRRATAHTAWTRRTGRNGRAGTCPKDRELRFGLVGVGNFARGLTTTLGGDLAQIVRGVANGFALAEPAILEHGVRVRMLIGFVRRALAPLAGADLLTLPPRL